MSTEDSPEKKAAYKRLIAACEEYGKFCDAPKGPAKAPDIRPYFLHVEPSNFQSGYNITCWSGGYMPSRIPVIVLPVRRQDLIRYRTKSTALRLLRYIGANV